MDSLFLRELWQPSEKDFSFFQFWDKDGTKARKHVMHHIAEMMSEAPCPKDSDKSSNLYRILVKKLRGQIGSFESDPKDMDITTRKIAKWVENIVKEAYYRREGKIQPKPTKSRASQMKEVISYEPDVEDPIERASTKSARTETETYRSRRTETESYRSRRAETESYKSRRTETESYKSRRAETESYKSRRIEPEIYSMGSSDLDKTSLRSKRAESESLSLRSGVGCLGSGIGGLVSGMESLASGIEYLGSGRTELEKLSLRSGKGSLRSERTELEKLSLRSGKESLRSERTELEKLSLRSGKGSLRSERTELEKVSVKSGSPVKSTIPKSFIIDGVEYVPKKRENENENENEIMEEYEDEEQQNFDMIDKRKNTNATLRQEYVREERVVGQKGFAVKYGASEESSSTVKYASPASRLTVDNAYSVVLKPVKKSQVNTVDNVPTMKGWRDSRQVNAIKSGLAYLSASASSSLDRSATTLVKNWSNWMISLTNKAKSLVTRDGSRTEYSTGSEALTDSTKIQEKIQKFINEPLQQIRTPDFAWTKPVRSKSSELPRPDSEEMETAPSGSFSEVPINVTKK